jgi:hypothetical protein
VPAATSKEYTFLVTVTGLHSSHYTSAELAQLSHNQQALLITPLSHCYTCSNHKPAAAPHLGSEVFGEAPEASFAWFAWMLVVLVPG